jgi:hypothetical protein
MEITPRRDRLTQLSLFWEKVAAPQWGDLSEATRVEAARLLAQLLREAGARAHAPRSEGAGDE